MTRPHQIPKKILEIYLIGGYNDHNLAFILKSNSRKWSGNSSLFRNANKMTQMNMHFRRWFKHLIWIMCNKLTWLLFSCWERGERGIRESIHATQTNFMEWSKLSINITRCHCIICKQKEHQNRKPMTSSRLVYALILFSHSLFLSLSCLCALYFDNFFLYYCV